MLADIFYMSESIRKRSSLMLDLEKKFSTWFLSLADSNRKTVIFSLIFATLILSAASSLIVYFFPAIETTQVLNWIPVLIGFPAGLTAFSLLYVWLEIYGKKITSYKEKTLYRKRIQHILIALIILLPTLVLLNSVGMPYGLGGIIIIVAFLSTVDILRRTDSEYEYYITGQIDPREIKQDI